MVAGVDRERALIALFETPADVGGVDCGASAVGRTEVAFRTSDAPGIEIGVGIDGMGRGRGGGMCFRSIALSGTGSAADGMSLDKAGTVSDRGAIATEFEASASTAESEALRR